jgi:ABC-2 type transport system permease protein
MSPALVISKREIRTYFNSPIAYIVVAAFILITGPLFFTRLLIEKQAEMRGLFEVMSFWFMLLVPAVTMRLLSEEKGAGTLELLITMPVRDWEVVLGKFLAAMALICTAVALTVVFALTVKSLGPIDKGSTIGGYLGLVMIGGAYAAIGVMASAFTRNQVVAFIISSAICFTLYLVGQYSQVAPEMLQPLMSFLSIHSHFESFGRGVIDSRDVIYYLSVMAISLLLATVSLESRKWK